MLSRIPLRWMIRQTFECNTGILFSTAALAETGLDLHTIYPLYQETKRPTVGPSPQHVEQYESQTLPPLRRRSTALGVDPKSRKASTASEATFVRNGHSVGSEKPHANGIKRRNTTDSERGDIFNPLYHSSHTTSANTCSLHPDLLPEQVEDHFDALAPVNDMLANAKGWWVLEYWPIKVRVQKKDSEVWEKVVRANRGRYRAIREIEPKMHWSVVCKKEESGEGYKVKNPVDKNAVWQVAT